MTTEFGTLVSDDELRRMAENACKKANGDDWKTMYSGNQEAEIAAWIDGFKAGLSYKAR